MTEQTAEQVALPEPSIEYHSWGRYDFDPDVVSDDAVRLHSVHEISVSRDPDGAIYAYLRGPMKKRDGQRGRHQRSVRVAPHPAQPRWLTMLFADAVRRLPTVRTADLGLGEWGPDLLSMTQAEREAWVRDNLSSLSAGGEDRG